MKAKVNVLAKPHPYIFFTLKVQPCLSELQTDHFVQIIWQICLRSAFVIIYRLGIYKNRKRKCWFTIIVTLPFLRQLYLLNHPDPCSFTLTMFPAHPQIFSHIFYREFTFQLHLSFTCIQVILAVVQRYVFTAYSCSRCCISGTRQGRRSLWHICTL